MESVKKEVPLEEVFNRLPALLCSLDRAGRILNANDQWRVKLGYNFSEMLGSSVYNYVHPEDHGVTKQNLEEVQQGTFASKFCNRQRHANGTYRDLEWNIQCIDGTLYATVLDVTDFRSIEKIEHHQTDVNKLYFDQSLTGIGISLLHHPLNWSQIKNREKAINYIFKNLKVERINDAFLKQFNTNEQFLIGQSIEVFFGSSLEEGKKIWQILMEEKRLRFEIKRKTMDGKPFWAQVEYNNLYNEQGWYIGFFGMQIDITARKDAEMELERSEKQLRLITDHVADVIWAYDVTNKRYAYVSSAIFSQRGYTPEQILGQPLEFSIHPEDVPTLKKAISKGAEKFILQNNEKSPISIELRATTKEGKTIWVETSATFRRSTSGRIEAVGVFREITDRKYYEEKILNLSYRDRLTGLYNRRYVEEQLSKIAPDPHSYPITLMMCDVNGLKLTNDVFGHDQGDQLLIQSAELLSKHYSAAGVVARVGGDEFIVVSVRTTEAQGKHMIDKLHKELDKARLHTAQLSISFGLSTAYTSSDSLQDLFKEAEIDMYRNKMRESSQHKRTIVQFLIDSLYKKSPYEKRHSEVVSLLCYHLAKEIGYFPSDLEEIKLAGMLHDIGKIGIDSSLLTKRIPLSADEWEILYRHAEIGFHILRSIHNFGRIGDWILTHHERPDGKGYPQGLLSEAIPLAAKIIAVANAYDAMTSPNSYRSPKTHLQACEELVRFSGSQFDSAVVQTFLQLPIEQLMASYEADKMSFGGKAPLVVP